MKLEYNICILKQAKKLHKLGVKAKSYFTWQATATPGGLRWDLKTTVQAIRNKQIWKYQPHYPAYTFSELSLMLPCGVNFNNTKTPSAKKEISGVGNPMTWKNSHFSYSAAYTRISDGSVLCVKINEYETHAKADLLIHLLEKEIIKPENLKF